MNKPTPEQILAAAKTELARALQLLIAARNREYRETGVFSETLAAAIAIIGFVRYDLMTGLVSPAEAKTTAAKLPGPARIQ